MFGIDFYPTPIEVVHRMFDVLHSINGITILEPSAGSGNIVREATKLGAKVIACEIDKDLRRILDHDCNVIEHDFFNVTSDRISHVDAIIMNPPFSNAEKHIQHAFEIAPDGCTVVALCNTQSIKNDYSTYRKQLNKLIDMYGYYEDWGNCFSTAQRVTDVNVSMVYLKKPGSSENMYQDFFMDEEPEDAGINGIMKYDAVKDIVNRYVAAVKLYDDQIKVGIKMRELINIFPTHYNSQGKEEQMKYISCNPEKVERYKIDFKKGLQKRAWKFIFDKLNMQQHSTKSLKEDINKFVEQQSNVPFTMKNIYRMLEIVVGTTGARMDKALLEVFDKLTMHYDENRYCVEGWKTNSHYLVNQKFIINYMCEVGWSGEISFKFYNNGELIEDLAKALCYLTGKRYDETETLGSAVKAKAKWGEWFDWEFFTVKCFKKGTMHFKFNNVKVWEEFNYNIARIKGYPLYESIKPK